MQTGRKLLWKLKKARDREPLVQLSLEQAWGRVRPPSIVQQAQRTAAAHFWAELQDLATLHPKGWKGLRRLPAQHPFLAMRNGQLIVNTAGRVQLVPVPRPRVPPAVPVPDPNEIVVDE